MADSISLPSIALPKGGGAIKGIGETVQPDAFTGTGNLSIPLSIPASREGSPGLTLDYNSGAGNGPFGIGFSLSLPRVSRSTEKSIPRYTESDTFVLTGAGNLVAQTVVSGGMAVNRERQVVQGDVVWNVKVYIPQLEGSFSLIEQWIDTSTNESYWLVTTGANETALYGQSRECRIADPDDPTHIFEWLLEKAWDAKGNVTLYSYKQENDDNVPDTLSEADRKKTANAYIRSIRYGKYFSGTLPPLEEHYAYEVVFNYGEYDLLHPDNPPGTWTVRQDPFSSYRSGFEIRTYRLCHDILIYHHFTEEFNNTSFLVRAFHLEYEQTPIVSFLRSVQTIGYRRQNDGSYERQEMPPLQCDYTPFVPEGHVFKPLTVEDQGSIPGADPQYLMVDLYGEGIPGILYSDQTTTLYWEARGDGHYAFPEAPNNFPIEKNLENANYILADLDSNGRLDIMVSKPPRGGYYGNNNDGSWTPYQNFESYPLMMVNPHGQMVDMEGNGLADLVFLGGGTVQYYPSLGTKGYGFPVSVPMETNMPASDGSGITSYVGFADMFGDGLQHRVKISSGIVACWPNLGYGEFGNPVFFDNAPRFDDALDTTRLFLADLDGSGTADLIYAFSDRVEVFLNQSGNSFSEAIIIPLPVPYDNISQIMFGDVAGNGAASLVFTVKEPEVAHYYYDFTAGSKPYLLSRVDNNMGAVTGIRYCSSTKYYLDDKRAGKPWVTRLPFPVQVVQQVESIDSISHTKLVQSFLYHDGYFDPVDREFRGFGFVEQMDTQFFDGFVQADILTDIAFETGQEEYHVSPVLTKTWFNTGAFLASGIITKQYEYEYFHGDPQEYKMPDSTFDPVIEQGSGELLRQAYSALKGIVIRQEVYALDNKSGVSENPYTVSESSAYVRLVQPIEAGNKYASFYTYEQETISYNYERVPDDPRIQHNFTLKVDSFGAVTESCTVFYGRRSSSNPDRVIYPEQTRLKCMAQLNRVINKTGEYRLLGMPCEQRSFEIAGLDLEGQSYFSFDHIRNQVDLALASSIVSSVIIAGTPTARLLSWQQMYYWNEAQDAALPLGDITQYALLHHEETSAFSPEMLVRAFGTDRVTDTMLEEDGGYTFRDGYWWNRGRVYFYYQEPEQFFMVWKGENIYAPEGSSLRTETTVQYDPYYLMPVQTTEYLTDTITNVVTALIDYQAMQPRQVTDINNNITQVLYDPMSMVIVSTIYGEEDGKIVGDAGISTYIYRPNPTFTDVLAQPEYYLQDMATYFYYDTFAWLRDGQPMCSIALTRQEYISDLPVGDTGTIQRQITYGDGFGREIEMKTLTDAGLAVMRDAGGMLQYINGRILQAETEERWVVSGKTVYNNKGLPAEQYFPYFTNTPEYEEQTGAIEAELLPPPTVTFYDPLLRVVRINTPKGFFSKTEFHAWEQKHFDADDTVKDSPYYRTHMPPDGTEPLSPAEKDALEKAAVFFNTPAITVLDNQGYTFLSIENNLGYVSPEAFTTMVAGTGITSQEVWDELVVQGYLTSEGWLTPKFQPYQPGFVLELSPPFEQFEEPLVLMLKENCLTTYSQLDIQGNEVEIIDPRLYYSNVTEQTSYYNFRYVYDMGGNPLSTDSVDAGIQMNLNNIFGNSIHSWNARNFHIARTYDRLQRLLEVIVEGGDALQPVLPYTAEQIIYGEYRDNPDRYNARGQIYQYYDQAGLLTTDLYSIQNQAMVVKRRLRQEYKQDVRWNEREVLEEEEFPTTDTYNAIGGLQSRLTPDNSLYLSSYGVSGLLKGIDVNLRGTDAQVFVEDIEYDAAGQRTRISYGNGVVTDYTYESTTQRLITLRSVRPTTSNGGVVVNNTVLQDIAYTYDPVGNITQTFDSSYETIFCDQQMVEPRAEYTYDALYRLIKATGRQHPGIQADTHTWGFKQTKYMPFCPANPGDMDKLQNYKEFYTYDDGGNMTKLQHVAPPSSPSWTRNILIADNSNRCIEEDDYAVVMDAAGNMLNLENMNGYEWSYRNTLSRIDHILREGDTSDSDYFTYDYTGNRVRKVVERYAQGGALIEIEEKIYIGTFEVKRLKRESATITDTIMDRQSLHVKDGDSCVAITYYWVIDDLHREGGAGTQQFRYQLDNIVGSSCVEVDEKAQVISYEEYFSYGGTAVIAGNSESEVSLKDYRYSGKECDDSSGLYYYGARYYISWLGRWVSPDPIGPADGLNLYEFVSSNPISEVDSDGTNGKKPSARTKPIPIFSLNHSTAEVFQLYNYVSTPDQEYYAELADRMSQAIHIDSDLMNKSSSARFPSDIEGEVWDTFERHRGLHIGSTPALKAGWQDIVDDYGGSKTGSALYSHVRSPGFSSVLNTNPVSIDFKSSDWVRPPEVHHLLYKSIRPEYAVQTWNLMLATRGNSTETGQHEGVFHQISSARQGNLYQTLVPAVERLILSWAGQTPSFYTPPVFQIPSLFPSSVVAEWSSSYSYTFSSGIPSFSLPSILSTGATSSTGGITTSIISGPSKKIKKTGSLTVPMKKHTIKPSSSAPYSKRLRSGKTYLSIDL